MNQPDVGASTLPVSIPIVLLHQAFGDDPGAEVEVSAETVVLRFFVDEERTRWLEITTRREGRDAVFDCVVRFSDGRPLSEEDRAFARNTVANLRYAAWKAAQGAEPFTEGQGTRAAASAGWWSEVRRALEEAHLTWEPFDPERAREEQEPEADDVVWFHDNWMAH
jgi:hypothetical protein